MNHRPRFVFSGHAAAFGGRIVRPRDVTLATSATCSLTVSGGRSEAAAPASKFDTFFSVGSARARAEGAFVDARQYDLSTRAQVPRTSLAAVTHVAAEVSGLVAGDPALGQPQLRVEAIRGGLIATSPHASGEPAFTFDKDTAILGITVDRYQLVVELDLDLFNRYNTRSKLLVAADDPASFGAKDADPLFLRRAVNGMAAPAFGRLIACGDVVHATFARSVSWRGPAFPNSEIDGNAVDIPDLGRVYFAELLVSAASRRATMLRLELGSPVGGDCACCDYQDNGSWGY
jgi:hypothetical protein